MGAAIAGSPIVALAILALVWFYSEELIGFFQLDRAQRMANRKLDRLEDEQISIDVDYYASKEVPDDAKVKKALEGKKRMETLRQGL